MTGSSTTMMEDDSSPPSDDDYDAFVATFDRGSMLRKLRQLEAEDEKLRQMVAAEEAEAAAMMPGNGNGSSDTLHYDSYLQQQTYWDDLKHCNYRFIDFGYVSGTSSSSDNSTGSAQEQQQQALDKQLLPLMIEQDRTGRLNKGGTVWDAGVILAEHVVHEQTEWKSRSQQRSNNHGPTTIHNNNHNTPVQMVELGAGTGITGLFVATALPDDVHMAITDLPQLLPLMEKNLGHNPHLAQNCTAFPLAWGTNNVTAHYDVILGADVVAGIYDPVKLAKTIADLCHDRTIVYLAVNTRLTEIIATFESAMVPWFDHLERRSPVSRNKNPNVSILVATGKRSAVNQ